MKRPTLLGVKVDECATCGLIGPHLLFRRSYWIHIFWLPILFVGFSHGMVCSQCGEWTGIPWRTLRRGMKVGTLPLARPRPRFATLDPDDYGRRPRPEAVLDPIQLNRKRGAWDLYLKVWPALVVAVILGAGFVLPALRSAGVVGQAPIAQATAGPVPTRQDARPTSNPSAAAAVDWSNLHIGDCFNIEGVDGLTIDALPSARTTAPVVTRVSCASSHTFEVFAALDDPTPMGTEYPGDDVVFEHADATCGAAFARYVGIDWQASHLRIRERTPNAHQWRAGDRRIGCVLYDPDTARASRTQRDAFDTYASPSGFDISVPAGWTAIHQYGDHPGTLITRDKSTLVIRVGTVIRARGEADARQALADAIDADLDSIDADVTGSTTLTSGGLDWDVTRSTVGSGTAGRLGFDAIAAADGRTYKMHWESPAAHEDPDTELFMEILESCRPSP